MSLDQQSCAADPSGPLPLVSALVSTYNAERFIRGCLEDLESQTIADRLEIIVVDSGSQQNERAIVEDFQRRYRNIRYVRTDQRETVYQAWNRGVKLARGRYLTNANTDDRHRRDALERLVEALEANPQYALAYADCAVTSTENQTFDAADVTGHCKWSDFDARALFRCCFIGPQPVWRRSLHERHGFFDEKLKIAGDYEFWLRVASRGERFLHVREVLGLYLETPTSVEHANRNLCSEESELARQRHWALRWGRRPPAGGCFFVTYIGKRPLISVVIPTRNGESLLVDALRSLVEQDYDNWEALVVNDSGRPFAELAQSLDPLGRIRVVDHFAHFGPGAARNTALRLSRGEVVCYLAETSLYRRNHLSTVLRAMQQEGAAFVHTACTGATDTIEPPRRAREPPHGGGAGESERHALLVWNCIPLATCAHRRDCLAQCGFFDETLPALEDWELLIRMADRFDLHSVPAATIEMRPHAHVDGVVTTSPPRQLLDAYSLIYSRHGASTSDRTVRRARREMLARLADHERNYGAAGPRRTVLLFLLSALGGSLPVRLALNRYLWRLGPSSAFAAHHPRH
jgi:O-antigen biosynthesis protein